MRVLILLFLTLNIASVKAVESKNTALTLQFSEEKLSKVMQAIENQSNRFFLYSPNIVDVTQKVTIDIVKTPLESTLASIFDSRKIKYEVTKNQIILSRIPKSVATTQQQNKTIKGKVSSTDGEALPGAAVVVKGSSKGVVTDFDGNFIFQGLTGDETLLISFVGMEPQEVVIGQKTTINITLVDSAIGLDEVVAVGYGTQKKINLTGAVSSVDMDEIAESRPITNISSALSGVAPGLSITSSNNRPDNNGNADILVRGQGTLNNSAPLIIVDGVEGSLSSVNPQDVESVSVLKDAASAAIYGSRAANGVILVTTKKGKLGKVIFDYSGQVSFQNIGNSINLVTDYATYMELYNEGRTNSGMGEQFSQEKIEEWRNDAGANPLKYPNSDWQEALFKTGVMNQHNLSASGGTDKIHFYLSYNLLDNPGVVDNSGFKKHSLRSNLESTVTDWFTMGVQLNGYTTETEMGSVNMSNVFGFAQASTPGIVFESNDGRYGTVNNPEDDPQSNSIIRQLYTNSGEDKQNSIRTRAYATLTPIESLKIQGSYVYDFYDRKQSKTPNFIPTWDFYTNTMVSDGVTQTSIRNQNWNSYRHFMDVFGQYEKRFGSLDFSILAGASQEQYRSDSFTAYKLDLIDPSLGVINGAVGEASASGYQTEWAMNSYFGRLNLAWEGKYLFEANLRRDGSSRFLDSNRWGYFPSFSVGWRMSEESFLQNIDGLSNLKLRASYGALGNNAVGNYDAIPVYSQKSYVLDSSLASGLAQSSIANANLTWESTYITDIGMDFSFIEGRFSGTVDYFNKVTKDILISLPSPAVHGYASIPKQNAAQVSNKGIEMILSYNGTLGNEFKYSITGNATYIKNNVDKFKGEVASYSGDYQILENRPVKEKYILQFDRIVQTDNDVAIVNDIISNAPLGENGEQMNPFAAFGRPEKGDVLYKDMNNDGLINNDDRFMTGENNLPDWTYGLGVNASYKGWDFNMLLQGSKGVKETFVNYNYSSSVRYGYQINADIAEGRYYEGRDVANDPASFPRLLESSKAYKNNLKNSTFWLQDKSYLRIKNIQLGYTFSSDMLNRINLGGINRLRLYGSLENYFTFTDWKGLDPEVVGVNYPVIKQALIGLNLSF